MADQSQPIAAPQLTTSPSPPNPPYTPRSTSIPDDSETEYVPTPLHSPGGPQYEDLPPSYDFALSDARNGVASLDAGDIEAHRVSANEGPDEPEVWEYRVRGETAEDEEVHEYEEAPAYEGHVPVQHVASSVSIPVGRVRDLHAASSVGSRVVPRSEGLPHPVPVLGSHSLFENSVGSKGHRSQPWTPFGAPGYGPFGAPSNGPFGALGNGPCEAPGGGTTGRGHGARSSRGRTDHEARSGPSQDWVAFGQNMGKWGEEFGQRMGNWGEQLGRQAGAMGEQIGRQAGAMGQQLGRDTGAWATAYSGTVMATHTTSAGEPSGVGIGEPPRFDEPPSYQGPMGVASQEATGVLNSDHKVEAYPLGKAPQSSSEKPLEKTLGKLNVDDHDDDESSISSDSSDSSTSSDSDDDDYDEAQAIFLKRIESINTAAETARSKGKKSHEEVEHERDLAIAKAAREKEDVEIKIARKQSRRTQKRELRNRRRELMREYRQKKSELREKARTKSLGKGKAKKGTDWKELKKEYKAKRRALKRERMNARREWKMVRREGSRAQNEGSVYDRAEQKLQNEKS